MENEIRKEIKVLNIGMSVNIAFWKNRNRN